MTATLRDIHAFIRRADMVGTREEPFAYGTAVFLPELPLRHDANYLWIDRLPETDPVDTLIAEAERLQGAAGLGHRMLMFEDPHAAAPLVEGFTAAGWQPFRGEIMTHQAVPTLEADTGRVQQTDDETLRAARTRNILRYDWCTPEVARQLLDARQYSPVHDEVHAVFVDDEPVAWAELYVDGGIAQIESVATEPDHRRQGHASAIVARLVEVGRAAGAETVFLCADADDTARDLYERLGFRTAGHYLKVTLSPA